MDTSLTPSGTATPSAAGTSVEACGAGLVEAPWAWWRSQMPVAGDWAYLDHAAVAPLSRPAADAAANVLGQATQAGDLHWPEWAATAERLRGGFAKLISAAPEEITLVPNTTAGINLVAQGYPWAAGDNMVVPEGEFPSNLFPWLARQSDGVEVRVVPRRGDQVHVDDLIDHCDQTTRMITVSWVGFASGFRVDLDRLVARAHERGVLVFVDAIQGLGMYNIDVNQTPVDFLAADGHKWLLGPEGAGMTYIRKEHLDRLRCTTVGWNSVENSHLFSGGAFELKAAASRFEGGSLNMVGLAALEASVGMFLGVRQTHGVDAIGDRVIELAGDLHDRLAAIGIESRRSPTPRNASGIVNFKPRVSSPAEIRQRGIDEGRFIVSCRDGGVRASLHAYNTVQEIADFVDCVGRCEAAG